MSKFQFRKFALMVVGLMVMTLISTTAVVAQDNCLDLGNGQGLCFANGAFYVTGAEDQSDMDTVIVEDPAPVDDVDLVNPEYGLLPQMQIGHPSWYKETGIGNTREWNVRLEPGTTAIITGLVVDGVDGGVLKAVEGPGQVTAKITDGLMLVTINEWAEHEFCFRLGQMVQFDWARDHIEPLAGWSC